MPRWRNGRRVGLKIQWITIRAGSTPAPGTTQVIRRGKERIDTRIDREIIGGKSDAEYDTY